MCFVPVSMLTRAHGLACALLLACGGLAEDGPRAAGEFVPPPPDELREDVAHRREQPTEPTEPNGAVSTNEPRGAVSTNAPRGAVSTARWASVGEECGGLDPSGEVAVVVGTVELRSDPRCEGASWCLRHAPAVERCTGSVSFDAPTCSTDALDFVAIPPPRTPAPAWHDNTCTCRCDGEEADVDYCACPQGMRCAPLIPSAGVNSAARAYLGSYCVD